MPLDEYLEFLKGVNVVVDQAYSVSAGVNALYNMAMGKVVLGGGDQEFLDELGVKESPLIQIKPSVEDIEFELEKIIINRNEIERVGKLSRSFVERHHNYSLVARKYLEVWESW
jgi:hypothetical protein